VAVGEDARKAGYFCRLMSNEGVSSVNSPVAVSRRAAWHSVAPSLRRTKRSPYARLPFRKIVREGELLAIAALVDKELPRAGRRGRGRRRSEGEDEEGDGREV
jgi:hypothetical protein